ncbi:MAG: aspartate carbamoyltransferase catalytic subunit [Desulfotomaculum sp.]|nr:aspartate carbamoyltransferase catalytic subunit [Desulfotomaculum sp.]
MGLQCRHLLGLEHISVADILKILATARPMKDIIKRQIKKVPTLRGRVVTTVFYENSTRTKMSFDLAAKYLSADVVGLSAIGSSIQKGESLADTARTVAAMGADVLVLRHPASGAAALLADLVPCAVINAGDGRHEHPTQALLDLFTIKDHKGSFEGLKVAIIGDILHSRVARSNIWGLTKLGVEVRVAAPATLLPPELSRLGVKVYTKVEEALAGVDVINVLRLQLERQKQSLLPTLREYAVLYGVNKERLALAKEDALLMHPGPMNRGIEITAEVADGDQAVITEQVTNGVAIRMALLYLLTGGEIVETIN